MISLSLILFFWQDLESVLFDDEYEGDAEVRRLREVEVEQALCLPVSVRQLVDNSTLAAHDLTADDSDEGVRFFLVDCRPADEYNAGHLPTAFHLDCNLMLQGGEVFNTAVQALLSSKRQALASNSTAGGEHLCFMGCGSLQSDQYTHMVVASFLHSNTHYVTLLKGGYRSLHEYFGENIDNMLADHNSALCLVCLEKRTVQQKTDHRNGIQSPSTDFLGKLGAAMKLKSKSISEVKEKLLEYIVNPGGGGGGNTNNHNRGVAGKRLYRNMAPVFSIGDEDLDHDPDVQDGHDDSQFEEVTMSSWLKRPDIIEKFHCKELRMNGDIYESELLVSATHVYVLRPTGKKDKAKVVVRRPLSAIAKITCKKRNRDVITFKYGMPEGDTLKISDVDT
ncbi:hypothetical protein AAG570_003419 [Ranatra chinensis]|uniref:Rhodanese domain-containing protein n=1 Tax=Ranatra chinensis TaxID=642074 RepID=A0ABD0Y3N3_9HEMI